MVAENVKNIRRRIEETCVRTGRLAEDVTLVAVTKTFSESRVREAVEAGVLDIGENFVQELVRKRQKLGDDRIRWHFVGHLQTNKVRQIAGWIHLIHSLDSLHLGKEISENAGGIGKRIDVLVEVNTSGEGTKFGVRPEETETLVEGLSRLPSLRVQGLMTMAGGPPGPEFSRAAFRVLREIRDNIQQHGLPLRHLSMGMTNDFEVAIEEGATIVRIGTAIFGERIKPAPSGMNKAT